MNRGSRAWFGIVLIILGLLFFMDRGGASPLGTVLRLLWPVLLVLIGLWMFSRSKRGRRTSPAPPSAGGFAEPERATPPRGGTLRSSSLIGNLAVRVPPHAFDGGTVSVVFGDSLVDLSAATLAPGEQVLRVHGVFGGSRIAIPGRWKFAIDADTMFGSISIANEHRRGVGKFVRYSSPGFDTATSRLRIFVATVFGDITVEGQ